MECSQHDDNWNSSDVFEKWRHLSQDEVKSIRDSIYAFVSPGAGTLYTACLSQPIEFDRLVVLSARGGKGDPCPPIRFLLQRQTALGVTEEWEEWAYPSEMEMVLRQLPAWNILTDPLPIGGDIRFAGWQMWSRDIELHPEFCVCEENDQGKWNVKIDPDWCFGSPFKTGHARPGSMLKNFTLDGGVMFEVPSWRDEDGTLDKKLSYSKALVGGDGHTNIWSLVMYDEGSNREGEKSCKVRFCVWDLADEKIPKNAKCTGSFCFVLQDGIVKDGSIRTEVANGRYTVSVKRVRKDYVAEREGQEVKVTYSEKHFVRYKLPSQIRSVNSLNGKGMIEWDDIDIRYGDECLSLFGSWPLAFALLPLDFIICSSGEGQM
ncbi:MAG: hypothetical protein IJ829_00730 [Kiritimatiellae bacterium]|nr:hypothetical protein [Kiritimatiellia bacterium]